MHREHFEKSLFAIEQRELIEIKFIQKAYSFNALPRWNADFPKQVLLQIILLTEDAIMWLEEPFAISPPYAGRVARLLPEVSPVSFTAAILAAKVRSRSDFSVLSNITFGQRQQHARPAARRVSSACCAG